MSHEIKFNRNRDNILGSVSLLEHPSENVSEIVFASLPARSGQCGYTHTDWIPAKSPIPPGNYWLDTKFIPLLEEPKGTPFFQIGSAKGSCSIIDSAGRHRTDIGLHLENNLPGSAGCVVLLWDTPALKEPVFKLFSYLKQLNATEPYVRFTVL